MFKRICVGCRKERAEEDFPFICNHQKVIRGSRCKDCMERINEIKTNLKQCSKCLKKKQLTEFYKQGNDYYKKQCKQCYCKVQSALQKKRRLSLPKASREINGKTASNEQRSSYCKQVPPGMWDKVTCVMYKETCGEGCLVTKRGKPVCFSI